MSATLIAQIFFFYGLAFFSMGLAILLELVRASDPRLRRALSFLAFFGLVHGGHEWLEMFEGLAILPGLLQNAQLMANLRISILAISFFGLGGFGSALLVSESSSRWKTILPPAIMSVIWGIGILLMRNRLATGSNWWDVADVWTRYALAIPSALLAFVGLLALRRSYLQAGQGQYGRDSMVAAFAFALYGVVGQSFTRASLLPPSTVLNADLFFELFGFPVQLLRAAAAVIVAISVIRVMRSFEGERQARIADLQAARLREATRREELRGELLYRVVQAQEAERQRIARELHDETGQALTAIGLGLRGVAGKFPKADTSNLNHLEQLTNHALDELQRLIAGLRPSHLDDLGLPAALRWYANEIESHTPLSVRVELLGEEKPMPGLLNIGLFRVAQEALTNVAKHASADEALLRVTYGEGEIRLEVQDDGIGFDIAVIEAEGDRTSWGMMGMRERVALMGGEFECASAPGEGTQIIVSVPFDQTPEEEYDHSAAVG
jgi:signal transduction histidine kinase